MVTVYLNLPALTAGKPSTVTVVAANGGTSVITRGGITLAAPAGWAVQPASSAFGRIPPGGTATTNFQVTPPATPYSSPAALTAAVTYTAQGATATVTATEYLPAITNLSSSGADQLAATVGGSVAVTATASSPTTASLQLTAPAGWTVSPATASLDFPDASDLTQSETFTVTPPTGSEGTATLTATATTSGGQTSTLSIPATVNAPGVLTNVTANPASLVETLALPVVITATADSPTVATAQLAVPTGWSVTPTTLDVNFPDSSLEQDFTFMVTPPAGSAGSYTLNFSADAGGATSTLGIPATVAAAGVVTNLSASGADALVEMIGSPVVVTLTASSPTTATVQLVAPSGWTVDPASAGVTFPDFSSLTQTTSFTVTPSLGSVGSATLEISAAAGGGTDTVNVPATISAPPPLSATDVTSQGEGVTVTVVSTFYNNTQQNEDNVTVSVTVPTGLTATATSPATFTAVAPGDVAQTTWTIAIPSSAQYGQVFTLNWTADYTVAGQATQITATSTVTVGCPPMTSAQGQAGLSFQSGTAGKWTDLPSRGGSLLSDRTSWRGPDPTSPLSPMISKNFMSVPPATDVARAWKAPSSGFVSINGKAHSISNATGAVYVAITKNDDIVWGPKTMESAGVQARLTSLSVARGDVIRFQASNSSSHVAQIKVSYDAQFEPRIRIKKPRIRIKKPA